MVYEAPFIVDDSRSTTEEQWVRIGEASRQVGEAPRSHSFCNQSEFPASSSR